MDAAVGFDGEGSGESGGKVTIFHSAVARSAQLLMIFFLSVALGACGGAAGDVDSDIGNTSDGGGSSGGGSTTPESAPVITVDGFLVVTENTTATVPFDVYDANDDPVQVTVEQTSGPTVEVTFDSNDTHFTFPVPTYEFGQETYTFNLTATDATERSDSAEVTVEIGPDISRTLFMGPESFTTTEILSDVPAGVLRAGLTVSEAQRVAVNAQSSAGMGLDMAIYPDSNFAPDTLIAEGTPGEVFESVAELDMAADDHFFIRIDLPQDTDVELSTYVVSPYLEDGFPASVGLPSTSPSASPDEEPLAVGNIDGDLALEILAPPVGNPGLMAWNADGSEVAGWPESYSGDAVQVSLGNLESDAVKLEVAAYSDDVYSGCETQALMALDSTAMALTGWPNAHCDYGSYRLPLLADGDGDGIDEVFFGGLGFAADGTALTGWTDRDELPGAADMDGDGDLELVFATDTELDVKQLDRTSLAGFPVTLEFSGVSRRPKSVPVTGDVTGDGKPNIVLVSNSSDLDIDTHVDVFDAAGNLVHEFLPEVGYYEGDFPALADLDNDGDAEIILHDGNRVHAYQEDGSLLAGWPTSEPDKAYLLDDISPLVADVDGDSKPDVVVMESNRLLVYAADGSLSHSMPLPIVDRMPAIADIDNDGRNEIIVSAAFSYLYVSQLPGIWVFDLGGSAHGEVQWGQLGGGPRRQHYWTN